MKASTHTVLSLLVLFSLNAIAQTEPEPDPQLTASFPGLDFFAPDGGKIYFDPHKSKTLVDPKAQIMSEDPEPVLETKFDGSRMCRIGFSWGPSHDPHFGVELQNAAGEWTWVGSMGGESIIVPGNGFIYTQGRANEMFDKRRKYRLGANGELEEVPQPFYRVDLETKVLKPIELRSEPQGGEVTARLPKGSSVHVLINRGNDYLVSTPLGLTGWVYLEEVLMPGASLEGIYYSGD